MKNPFVTICIPAYNRPIQLKRLLQSIDFDGMNHEIEILIAENFSPLRPKIIDVINSFSLKSNYNLKLILNENNIGYDSNLRNLIEKASGEFLIFMGDDDVFKKGALNNYINFLKINSNSHYFLRSYEIISNTKVEYFKYYSEIKHFEPSIHSYIELYRKSVFISGFTVKRISALKYSTNKFDGSLLYQLYLVAELAINEKTCYPNIILTQLISEDKIPFFGSSKIEKDFYKPGEITIQNSLNFLKGFKNISNYIDEKYNLNSTHLIMLDLSKYSLPILAIHRDKGIIKFYKYSAKIAKMGFNKSFYFYIYFLSLMILNKRVTFYIVRIIKNKLGRTPKL